MASIQEKIAKSLQSHEQNLAGRQYGKYFVRNMNLLLLNRDPEAWRAQQASKKEVPFPSAGGQTKSVPDRLSEEPSTEVPQNLPPKRKRKEGDDIDKLFDSTVGKKQKRSALPSSRQERKEFTNPDVNGLESILGAIKDAPKGDDRKYKKKKAG